MWGTFMQRIAKLLTRHTRKVECDVPSSDPIDIKNFRAFDKELKDRFRALQLEASVIGRRKMTDSGEIE
jgi:hypothetical protein